MSKWTLLLIFGFLTIVPLTGPTVAVADSVEDGRQALRGQAFPWYDASKDEIRPVAEPKSWGWEWPRFNFSFGAGLGRIIQIVFVLIVIILLGLLIYGIVRTYLARERSELVKQGANVQVIDDQARIEQLPFNVREPNADLLEQARKHYQQGDFNEAIVYLYSYMLVHLDKHQTIRLSKGKTNRQYLREMTESPRIGRFLEITMVSFEQVFFGRHTLEKGEFEMSWSQLEPFHQSVAEVTE